MRSRQAFNKKLLIIPIALIIVLGSIFVHQQIKNAVSADKQQAALEQSTATYKLGTPFILEGAENKSNDEPPTVNETLSFTGQLEYNVTSYRVYKSTPDVAGLQAILDQFDLSVYGYDDPAIASVTFTIKNINASSKDTVLQEFGQNALNINYNLSNTLKENHPEVLFGDAPEVTEIAELDKHGYVWPENGSTIEVTNYYAIDRAIQDSYMLDLAPDGYMSGTLQVELGTPEEVSN